MSTKPDPRAERMRRALRQSLIAVVERDGYAAATVASIATEAMVHRATFYRHYDGKEDLLLDTVGELLQKLNLRGELAPHLALAPAALADVLRTVERHATFYREVLGPGGSFGLQEQARLFLTGIAAQWLAAHPHGSDRPDAPVAPPDPAPRARIPVEFVAAHTANATLATVLWWLSDGRAYPAEDVAAWLMELLSPGVHLALGLPASGEAPPRRHPGPR